MILSVSRRTDVPAFYSDWFYKRIKEGYVLVRNPMNTHQVSRIAISPEIVDCIVFWTKNPAPMMGRLNELESYNYYFQFTLNSYGKDIEPNVSSKNNLINTFRQLSDKIGADRVIWRYDPVLLNDFYSVNYHAECFEKLARRLEGHTRKCIISFIDIYRNTLKNVKGLKILTHEDKYLLAEKLSKIAFNCGLKMDTCSEDIDLSNLGISQARCIDDRLIEKITGFKLNVKKDKGQRLECGCVASVDIGKYDTCRNGCKYCYANHSAKAVAVNSQLYDPNSPLLCSQLDEDDRVTERLLRSCKDKQLDLLRERPPFSQ